MRTGALWLGGLAAWLGALAAMLWVWTSDDLPPALLTGAAAALAVLALYAVARGAEPPAQRLLPESSLPTAVLAFGLAVMLNGLAFGLWLVLIGVEIALMGIAGLLSELWTRRKGPG
jgi:hypothetical protein